MNLLKRVSAILISGVLTASMLTACSEEDDKKEESSSLVITQEMLNEASSNAKTIFIAVNNYGQKCLVEGYLIPAGDYEISIEKTEQPNAPSPKSEEDIDVELAVEVSCGENLNGTKCKVRINDKGFPSAVIWYEDDDTSVVGGYPEQADEPGWTLDKADVQ